MNDAKRYAELIFSLAREVARTPGVTAIGFVFQDLYGGDDRAFEFPMVPEGIDDAQLPGPLKQLIFRGSWDFGPERKASLTQAFNTLRSLHSLPPLRCEIVAVEGKFKTAESGNPFCPQRYEGLVELQGFDAELLNPKTTGESSLSIGDYLSGH